MVADCIGHRNGNDREKTGGKTRRLLVGGAQEEFCKEPQGGKSNVTRKIKGDKIPILRLQHKVSLANV